MATRKPSLLPSRMSKPPPMSSANPASAVESEYLTFRFCWNPAVVNSKTPPVKGFEYRTSDPVTTNVDRAYTIPASTWAKGANRLSRRTGGQVERSARGLMSKTGSACDPGRGLAWLTESRIARWECIGVPGYVGLEAKTVPYVPFVRDLKAGRTASMTEKGRNLLVGDQERRAVLDVIGIDRIPTEDFATGWGPGRLLRKSRGDRARDKQQRYLKPSELDCPIRHFIPRVAPVNWAMTLELRLRHRRFGLDGIRQAEDRLTRLVCAVSRRNGSRPIADGRCGCTD
jgi:hypothetical protein